MFRGRVEHRQFRGGAFVAAFFALRVAAVAHGEQLAGQYVRIPVSVFGGGGSVDATAAAAAGSTFGQPGPVGRAAGSGGTTVLEPGFWPAAAVGGESSPACGGDCNGDGEVTVEELVRGVGIALGVGAFDVCTAFDVDGDAEVTIEELVGAVNNALNGCAPLPRVADRLRE